MWNDLPVEREAIANGDQPPSTRAFLSQFNRSFTPTAIMNDPLAIERGVDRRLSITPLLMNVSQPIQRKFGTLDPTLERIRHYLGSEQLWMNPEMQPSPKSNPVGDDEWSESDSLDLDSEDRVSGNGKSVSNASSFVRENDPDNVKENSPKNPPVDKEMHPHSQEPHSSQENVQTDSGKMPPEQDTSDPKQNKIEAVPIAPPNPESHSLKWRLHVPEFDADSDSVSDAGSAGSDDAATPGDTTLSSAQSICATGAKSINAPYNSMGGASWDEWEDQAEMLKHIDIITATAKTATFEYVSLI